MAVHPGWILAKTEKGRDAIAHRTHGLSQRARMALILVDGQTSVGDLQARMGASFPTLEAELERLFEAEFVLLRARLAAELRLRRPLGRQPQTHDDSLAELVRMACDAIGDDAVVVTRRIQSARTYLDMQDALNRAVIAVEGYAGTAKASQFRLRSDAYLRRRFSPYPRRGER